MVENGSAKWKRNKRQHQTHQYKTFVYAGSPGMSLEKDRLDWIIDVFHRIKRDHQMSFRFNVIGITKEAYLSIVPDHITVLEDLKHNIVFYGRQSHEVTIEYIKQADFSIFCRGVNRMTRAGFPTKVAESLACGTPVITNKTSNIADYIKNGKTGYVSENASVEALYSAVIKALKSKEDALNKMHMVCLYENPLHIHHFVTPLKEFIHNLK